MSAAIEKKIEEMAMEIYNSKKAEIHFSVANRLYLEVDGAIIARKFNDLDELWMWINNKSDNEKVKELKRFPRKKFFTKEEEEAVVIAIANRRVYLTETLSSGAVKDDGIKANCKAQLKVLKSALKRIGEIK